MLLSRTQHLFVVLLAAFGHDAFAISNIEDQRPGLPEEGISGHVTLSLDGQTGNAKEKNYEGAMRVNYRKTDDIVFGIVASEYGSTRDIRTTNNSFVHLRWVHVIDPVWASEAFAQWEEDEFDDLLSRTLLGGGGRYTVAEDEDVFSLAVGLGGFREREELDLQTYTEVNYAWRLNSYYAYQHKLQERIFVSSTAYFQPNVSDFDDIRALFTLGLSVQITNTLSLELDWQARYDSQPARNLEAEPPIDNKKVNTEYVTQLTYRF